MLRAPHSLTATIATALALGVTVGCGGSDGGDGDAATADFVTAADAICVTAAERDVAIQADQAAGDPASTAAFLADLQASREQVADELAALDVPEEIAARRDELVASRREAAAAIAAGVRAAEAEDLDGFESARARVRTINDDGDAVAADLGLEACARRLPAAEREEIAALIALTVETDAARELCAQRATDRFIADRFESVQACVAAQSRRAAADTAEITDLSGTSEVFATAFVDLRGAGGQGGEYEAGLVHEDGRWKLHTLVEVAPAEE